MNNNNNNTARKSFVDSFDSVSPALTIRYHINMHLDYISEFVKFADNTRDVGLLNKLLDEIIMAESRILKTIKIFENERDDKENID